MYTTHERLIPTLKQLQLDCPRDEEAYSSIVPDNDERDRANLYLKAADTSGLQYIRQGATQTK